MNASVLMSIYNETETEIMSSIKSVLNQSYTDFEVIVVHDNPDDANKDRMIQTLKALDHRIIVLENPINMGLAMSMNKAFSAANGQYIIRMDADDICATNRFEMEIQALESSRYDLVFSNYDMIDETGQILRNGTPALTNPGTGSAMLQAIVFSGIIHHPTVAMTREMFEKVGGYRNFPCSQDQDLWLRMIEQGCRCCFLDAVLLHYRVRQNSISGTNRLKQHETITYITKLLIERMRSKKGDSFSDANYLCYINRCVNDKRKEEYQRANSYLQCAKHTKLKINRLFYRCRAFVISSALRKSYLIKVLYAYPVLKYLNRAQTK